MGYSWLVSSQSDTPLSVYADSLPIESVITDIEKRSNSHFAYDPNFVKGKYVTLSLKNVTVKEILPVLFNGVGICYQESEKNHYLLYPCKKASWSLYGSVQDASTGEFLPFTSIGIINQSKGTIANEDGKFSFLDLKEDTVKLQVHYIGYHLKEISVDKWNGNIQVLMIKSTVALEGVIIEEYIEFINSGKYFGQLTINSNLLKGFPALGESDPIKSVRLLPGVGGNAETSSGIAMRGGKFDQTLIIFDDFQILHVDHFFGLFSTINHNMIKDIQVYRSGYSAKYSGFTSGLVQITGKNGSMKKVAGGLSTNIYSSSVYLEVPIIKDKWSTAVSYRKDNSWMSSALWDDKIVTPHIINEVRTKSPSAANAKDVEGLINFQDASFKTNFRLSKRHDFTFSYFNSKDKVGTNYSNPLDDEEDIISQLDLSSSWSNNGASFKWNHQLSDNYSAKLTFAHSKFNSVTNFENVLEIIEGDTIEEFQGLVLSNSFTQQRYRYDAEVKRPKTTWYFGVDIALFKSHFNFDEEDGEFSDDFNMNLPAIYLEQKHDVTSKFEVLIGSRMTYDKNDAVYFEPRFSSHYKINDHLKSFASYGYYYQHAKQYVPDVREGLVPDYWLLPNYENTFPTQAHLTSIGLEFNKNNWMVNTEFFYKHINNTAEQFPSISDLLESNSDFVKMLSSGTSRVVGSDLVIRKRFKRSSIWVGFGVNKVENTSDSVQTKSYQPYYANLGDVKLGYVYSWKKWEAGLTWTYLGGRKYTKVNNEITGITDVEVGNGKLPDYHRMDASISYKIELNKVKGAIRGTIFNLYNRRNVRTINFTQLDSSPSFEPQAIPISTLGIRPNLTLEINF